MSDPVRPSSSSEEPRDHSRDWRDADAGTMVIAYLLAGPLTFGLLGWGADHLLGTGFLVPLGILLGLGLSGYAIWLRYGKQ